MTIKKRPVSNQPREVTWLSCAGYDPTIFVRKDQTNLKSPSINPCDKIHLLLAYVCSVLLYLQNDQFSQSCLKSLETFSPNFFEELTQMCFNLFQF